MRCLKVLSIAVSVATPLDAQDVPSGCYVRDYSEAHLAQNPEQIVDRISIIFGPHDGVLLADVKVLLANQGSAARDGNGGAYVSETAANFSSPLQFGVECDGGYFDVIEFDDEAMTIETPGIRISGEGCGGEGIETYLVEAGSEATRYILYRDELGACF
ncbi:hypothetical protein [Yoonia sp. 2307UL14-13]|uniref:hypothetical protein n=1 Tax=Yoonia sp. 2307UL14-13 TaxID=3126506 RepID=UPI0030B38264